MTDITLKHLRKTTLAQIAAELIVDHTQDDGRLPYFFNTEEAKAAYDEVMAAGRDRFGMDEFANSVEAACEVAWQAAHDALYC